MSEHEREPETDEAREEAARRRSSANLGEEGPEEPEEEPQPWGKSSTGRDPEE